MDKDYYFLNIHQRINSKYFAEMYRRGYVGNNLNLYIFIFSQYDYINKEVYSSIPLKNGAQFINNKKRFIL